MKLKIWYYDSVHSLCEQKGEMSVEFRPENYEVAYRWLEKYVKEYYVVSAELRDK